MFDMFKIENRADFIVDNKLADSSLNQNFL